MLTKVASNALFSSNQAEWTLPWTKQEEASASGWHVDSEKILTSLWKIDRYYKCFSLG